MEKLYNFAMEYKEKGPVWKSGVDNPIHLVGIPIMVAIGGLALSIYAAERLLQKIPRLKIK